jgi:hypothetical protein
MTGSDLCPQCGREAGTTGGCSHCVSPDEPVTEFATVAVMPQPVEVTPTFSTSARGTSPAPPPSVAGYDVLDVLGRGGMGVVYKARQVALQRIVALKMILSGSHAGEQKLARFRGEAESVARLQHPHIVQVFEVGEADGHPFCALEFVASGSLAQQLGGTPQAPRRAAELLETLSRAMHHAHHHGIVHRDLKPANVLLAEDGSPKITDFGLAKQIDNPSGQTPSGAIMGTPSYMAPEQAKGQVEHIGPAADVYALGAILYELLTGRPPFRSETAVDTMLQVVNDEPVPLRRLQPKVPLDLETICLKCLHKEPAKRYASAAELADDVGRFLRGEPIQARPVSGGERLWRWCRRNPTLAIASGTAVTALVAALAVSIVFGFYQGRTATELAEKSERLGSALQESERNDRRVQREAATLALERGKGLCEAGEVARGMMWLARSLELAGKAEATDLERAIRANLGAWRTQLYPLQARLRHGALLVASAFSPDQPLLMTAGNNDRVLFWDVHTQRPHGPPLRLSSNLMSAALSPSGKWVATGTVDGSVQLWDVARRQPLGVPLRHDPVPIDALAFSPDDKLLATAARSRPVRSFDTATGQPVGTPLPCAGLKALAFAPDGKSLATGGLDGQVRLWDPVSGKALATTPGHESTVQAVAFRPDSKVLASAGADSMVRLWDLETGKPIGSPIRFPAYCLAYRADGRILATGGTDRTVRLWDPATGRAIGSPLVHTGSVHSVSFQGDGNRLQTRPPGSGRCRAPWKATSSAWPSGCRL